MIDLIEHLEKKEGFELLKEAQRVARVQIIVMTPLGFFPQEYNVGDKDGWGLAGAEFQQHKSGWQPEDFGEGWDFHICEKFHLKSACHLPIDKDYGMFYAIKNMNFNYFNEPESVPDFVKHCSSNNRITTTRSIEFELVNKKLDEQARLIDLHSQKFDVQAEKLYEYNNILSSQNNKLDVQSNSINEQKNSFSNDLHIQRQMIEEIKYRVKTSPLKRLILKIKAKIKGNKHV